MPGVGSLLGGELGRGELSLMKAILAQALYPRVALPDPNNGKRQRESDWRFHTRGVRDAVLHPTSALNDPQHAPAPVEAVLFGELLAGKGFRLRLRLRRSLDLSPFSLSGYIHISISILCLHALSLDSLPGLDPMTHLHSGLCLYSLVTILCLHSLVTPSASIL